MPHTQCPTRSKISMKPENFPEKVIWYSIIGTYVIYFCGLQFTLVPLIPWILAIYLAKKLWSQNTSTPPEERIIIPLVVWIWIIAVLFVELALIVSHADFNLGIPRTIFSSIYLARAWGSFALFPLIGCLKIRPKLIYRATCIICLQSIVILALCYVASIIHLPATIYTSPLKSLSGGGHIFYDINLYQIDADNGQVRLTLFAPWAPALALIGNIYLVLANQESDLRWRWIGIVGAIAMTVASVSRLGILCIAIIPIVSWLVVNFARPSVQIITGFSCFFSALVAPFLIELFQDFKEAFTHARTSSSQVREALGRIAIYRWWNDAPIWGHGFSAPKGPKIVAEMPIGSHHTWFGLLYMSGAVGALVIAIASIWSLIILLIKAQKSEVCRVGFSLFLIIMLFTFAENIESIAYIYWPGLVMVGIAFRQETVINKSVKGMSSSWLNLT
jgi:hypothetical protein